MAELSALGKHRAPQTRRTGGRRYRRVVPEALRGAAADVKAGLIVAQYEALPDVYEWLIPDAKLTPQGSVAALDHLVRSLPSDARVLDCSCGTGQLAVGLAGLGLDVVATDASAGMVRRTQTSPTSTTSRCGR